MEHISESDLWMIVNILLFINNAGAMAGNGTYYTFDVVYKDRIDNNLSPQQISRADCINTCYWSLVCAAMIYDTTEGNCYITEDIYTMFNIQRLSVKEGSDVYEWGSDDCPRDEWSFHKPTGYCLKYHNYQPVTYAAAATTCENEDSRLVNVMDAKQNDFMYFVGQYSGRIEIWLGGDVASNTWHLGGEITFTNWLTSAPTTGCVAFVINSGKWVGILCNEIRMFFCQKVLFNPCSN